VLSTANFTDTHFLKVYAVDSPSDTPSIDYIADVHLDSQWHASKFADIGTFFRHILFEDDLAMAPASWKTQLTKKRLEVESFSFYNDKNLIPAW
jgi:hypothetical protein